MAAGLLPHRPFFLAGGLSWALLAAGWAWQLVHGQYWPAHGLCFTLGFMPLFIGGFALSALPRWLGQAPPDTRHWLPAFLLLTLGALVLPGWTRSGAALSTLGWLWLWLLLCWRLCASSGAPRRHAQGVLLGMALIGLALGLAAMGETALATRLGLWAGLGTVFASALQRLTPFLHSGGQRDEWALGALLLALLLQAAAWQGAVPLLIDIGVAAMLLRSGFDPATRAARRTPFVAQLMHSLLWLVVSLLLAAAGQALASLHAYSLGFLCGTMLAMVSRVSAVHAGRSQVVDRSLRALHGLLQLVCLLRVLSACWPAAPQAALLAAAIGFAVLALGWLLRYGPLLWRGRASP